MPLRYRIAATIIIVQILLVGALVWITMSHARQVVATQIAASDRVLTQLISDLSRVALLTEDYADVQTFVGTALRDPRITTVLVADVRDRIVISTRPELTGQRLTALIDGNQKAWRLNPVRGQSNTLGTLAIEFSDRPIDEGYRQIQTLALVIGGSGILIIGIVGIALGYLVTFRLQTLASAADSVSAGSMTFPIVLTGRDEVARVARAFAAMVERLHYNVAALERTRDLLVEPTEAMTQGFALWDRAEHLILCNTRFRALFGEIEDRLTDGIAYADFCRLVHRSMACLDEGGSADAWVRSRLAARRLAQGVWELPLRDGRWLEVRESRTRDGGTVAIYTDITKDKIRQEALHNSELRLREIMASVLDAIITVDEDGRIETLNPAVETIFDWPAVDLMGRSIAILLARQPNKDGRGAGSPCSVADLLSGGEPAVRELWGIRRNGTVFPIEVSVASTAINGRTMLILTARDITERKAAERRILYHATHDALTGLPNRSEYVDRLETAIEGAGRGGSRLSVMFLDLDRFKEINDTLGHGTGDALLVAVARRLRRQIRDSDTVARMGGDEFIFLLEHIDPETAIRVGRKIVEAMQAPFMIQGHELRVTASLGISLFPDHGTAPEHLLKCADVALYQAKSMGRNQLVVFALVAGNGEPAIDGSPPRDAEPVRFIRQA
jgi:diguanylate cyclase (GGDEF)-like protein/PAS domain S-box-containing protein